MAQFTVNTARLDPYKNFKFRVKWDGRYVAGLSKCSALKRTTEVVKHREGNDPSSSRKSPGHTEYEAITFERGVTHDPEFENWANSVWRLGALGVAFEPQETNQQLSTDLTPEQRDAEFERLWRRCVASPPSPDGAAWLPPPTARSRIRKLSRVRSGPNAHGDGLPALVTCPICTSSTKYVILPASYRAVYL